MSAIKDIRDCLQSFNMDTASDIIEMLGQYKLKAEQKNTLSALSKKISMADQAAALALLENGGEQI